MSTQPSTSPQYTLLDILLQGINLGLEQCSIQPLIAACTTSQTSPENTLPLKLLRINHSGEVAAQGLYLGQAAICSDPALRADFIRASYEEQSHLRGCAQRLADLQGNTSVFAPLWFAGSFIIGGFAGAFGRAYSLGFLEETERQVIAHFDDHLSQLDANHPAHQPLINWIKQMQAEEGEHADFARAQGARSLPDPVPWLMRQTAGVMTTLSAWI